VCFLLGKKCGIYFVVGTAAAQCDHHLPGVPMPDHSAMRCSQLKRPANATGMFERREDGVVVAQRNPFYGESVGRSKGRGPKTKVSQGIQDVVEIAIWRLTGEVLRTRSASRTDAGVHALGQVSVFETASPLSDEQVKKGLNTRLPQGLSLPICRIIVLMSKNMAQLSFYQGTRPLTFLSPLPLLFPLILHFLLQFSFPSPSVVASSSPSHNFPIFLTPPLPLLHSLSLSLSLSLSVPPPPSWSTIRCRRTPSRDCARLV
jgi:hypothetical protein